MGRGIVRESGMDMDTWLYLTWRTSKDLLASSGKSAQCHVAAGMGGGVGRGWKHVTCMAENLHCSPETMPRYSTIQNKK